MSQEMFNTESDPTRSDAPEETLDALQDGSGADGTDAVFVSEQKKPINRTTLVMFLILALGGGGLYFMHLRTGPQSAAAASIAAAQANQTIGQFLDGGTENIKSMETMLRSTEKVVQQFNNYPSVRQVPLSELQTNPFRQSSKKESEDAEDPEVKFKLEQQRVSVLKAYQGLQLQSIMYGGKNKSCLINNTLYREGQQVSGFTIDKINADNVSVKQASWRFDLKMQK